MCEDLGSAVSVLASRVQCCGILFSPSGAACTFTIGSLCFAFSSPSGDGDLTVRYHLLVRLACLSKEEWVGKLTVRWANMSSILKTTYRVIVNSKILFMLKYNLIRAAKEIVFSVELAFERSTSSVTGALRKKYVG